MPLKINVLKNISWWLLGLYLFWLGFLVSLCLNQRNELLIPLITFFIGISIAISTLLFLLIKSIKTNHNFKKINLKQWFLIVLIPCSFYWLGNKLIIGNNTNA